MRWRGPHHLVALVLAVWGTPQVLADTAAPRISLTASPASLQLRTQRQATILINLTDADGAPVSGARLDTACLTGSLGRVEELGAGRYRALYQAPQARYPQVDLVVVRDESGQVGWLTLPLTGYGELVAETEPRAQVTLEVAGASFGPATAGADGIVRIPFQAPPGVTSGTIATSAEAAKGTSRPVDLGVPAVARLLALPPAADLVADGRSTTPIALFCLGPDLGPARGNPIKAAAAAGEIVSIEPVAPGRYSASYRAPAGKPTGAAQVTFWLADGAGRSQQVVRIGLRPPPPDAVRLVIEAPLEPKPDQGTRLATWGWVALGSGLASLAPGAALIGIDGQETCDQPAAVRCPKVYDTLVPGAVLTGLGAALVITGVVLHVFDGQPSDARGEPAGVGFSPLPGGGQIVGSWSF